MMELAITEGSDHIFKNRYQFNDICPTLGRGSYGECYRAKDKILNIDVAVKTFLLGDEVADKDKLEKAQKEATLLQSANNHRIAHYLDHFVGKMHNQIYYVIIMTCYSRGSLDGYIKDNLFNNVPTQLMLKWIEQTAQAVAFIHSINIIHRDLKLENFFVDDDLNLYLGDFGEAKNVELQNAATYVGTIMTMAPEVHKRSAYTIAADIWSLGCVWYQILTGTAAFRVCSEFDTENLNKVQNAEYDPPLDSKLPEIAELIKQMIVVDAQKRPSAINLKKILQKIRQSYDKQYQIIVSTANDQLQKNAEIAIEQNDCYIFKNRFKFQPDQSNIVGQHGIVHIGTDLFKIDNEKIAIKKIQLFNDTDIDKLYQESKFLQMLRHHRIAQIIDHFIGELNGNRYYFIIMDFYKNGSLQKYWENNQSCCSMNIILKWIMQMLEAVNFIHQNNIIHRDLKLDNFFVDTNENLFLGDFGESKDISQSFGKTCVGTQQTMAPEVFIRDNFETSQDKGYGTSADIWSLGCIWYQLIKHKPAFYGANSYDPKMIKNIKSATFDPIDRTDCPIEISNCISKQMIVVDPSKRVSAEQLLPIVKSVIQQHCGTLTILQCKDHLNKYNPINFIGTDKNEKLYKAYDTILQKQVLIKGYPVSGAKQEEKALKLKNLLQKLHHPLLVHILDCFVEQVRDKHYMFIVEESYFQSNLVQYVETKFIQNNIKVPVALVQMWMLQLVQAVEYLHSMNIIHRDIKLENCFLDDDLNICLGHFGIAKDLSSSLGSTFLLSAADQIEAPEIQRKEKYGTPIDIWQLSNVWQELLKFCSQNMDEMAAQYNQQVRMINGRKFENLMNIMNRMKDDKQDRRPTASDIVDFFWVEIEKLPMPSIAECDRITPSCVVKGKDEVDEKQQAFCFADEIARLSVAEHKQQIMTKYNINQDILEKIIAVGKRFIEQPWTKYGKPRIDYINDKDALKKEEYFMLEVFSREGFRGVDWNEVKALVVHMQSSNE